MTKLVLCFHKFRLPGSSAHTFPQAAPPALNQPESVPVEFRRNRQGCTKAIPSKQQVASKGEKHTWTTSPPKSQQCIITYAHYGKLTLGFDNRRNDRGGQGSQRTSKECSGVASTPLGRVRVFLMPTHCLAAWLATFLRNDAKPRQALRGHT